MIRRATALVVAVAVLLAAAACEPFYRDAENRGRQVQSPTYLPALLHDAEQAEAAHDPARAAELYLKAIETSPDDASPATLLAAARSLDEAGRSRDARALARYQLERQPDTASSADLQRFLADSYARDGLTARALDELGATSTLAQAASVDGLAASLGPLAQADALADRDPAGALHQYRAWLQSYGVPDHPLLREARDHILAAVWKAATGTASGVPASGPTSAPVADPAWHWLAHLPDQADAEIAAGHTERALLLYSEAYRVLPAAVFETHFTGFAKAAAAAADPEAIDPVAVRHAADGDAALQRHDLGEAIHQYRLAVAGAPWWAAAHENLAALLDVEGEKTSADLERQWAARLPAPSAVPAAVAVAVERPVANPPDSPPIWYRDGLADALAAGGVALAVTGGIVYAAGLSSAGQANAATDLDAYDRARSRAALEQPLGLSLLGAGIASASAGVVLYLRRDALRAPDTFAVAPARGGGLVTVGGRF